MATTRLKLAILLSYVIFAVLLNSVGTVILQSIASFGVDKIAASTLEAFKDLPIAIVSFLVAAQLPRFGYRRGMIAGLALVALACVAMPLAPSFWTTRLLFLATGVGFALAKVAVYSFVGLLTEDSRGHAGLLNTIEGVFMLGVLAGYWVFAAFIDPAAPASLGWLSVYWWLAGACLVAIALLATARFDEQAALARDIVDPPHAMGRGTASCSDVVEGAGAAGAAHRPSTPGCAGGPPPPAARGEDHMPARSAGGDFVAMLALAARPLTIVFVVATFLYVLIEQGIGTWLPTFNNELLGLSAPMSVQAASLFAAGLAAGRLGAGVIVRRTGWYPLLIACLAAMAVLIVAVLPLAESAVGRVERWADAPLAAFLLPLIGLFMAPIYPALNSAVLAPMPRREQSAMVGLIVVFSALGGTLGSLIVGRVFAAFGGAHAFYLMLAPIAAIAVAITLLRRMERVEASAHP